MSEFGPAQHQALLKQSNIPPGVRWWQQQKLLEENLRSIKCRPPESVNPHVLGVIEFYTSEKEKDMAAGAEDFYEEKLDRAERRRLILATVSDIVMDLLYHDRRDDEELTPEDLEEAITSGDISVEELAGYFGAKLREEVFGS